MAELYAQDPITQQPTPAPAPTPDFTAKRSKFLTSFAALDPDAKLDDAKLESILTDDTKRDEFAQYVGQLNPKFKMSGQELTDALGYKKKVQSVGGGQSSAAMPATASVAANGLPQDEPFAEVAPGPFGQPESLPYDAMSEAANILGLPASQQEQVILASFVGPRPAGAYQKRDDAGTMAEGAQYLSPASVAGQLNDDEQPLPAQESFLSAVGKNLGNIPGDLVRAGGNFLDAAGDFNQRFLTPESDVAPGYESQVGVVTDGKASDRMGAAMRDTGESMKFEIAANAKQSVLDNPTNGAAWGNLFGQGVNSIAQVGAASLVGGPLAGATMGGALGISSTKDAAREAGLSETEALYTSMALAPVVGALEEMGMGFITKNKAVTGLLTKTIVGKALAATGGKLTKSALAKAAASVLPEVVKRAGGAAGGEMVTEFLQAEAEGIAKLTADKLRGNESAPAGQGRYGVSAFDALVKSPIEQGIGGALGGGFAGGLHGAATRQPSANPKVSARQRQPEGTKPVAAHLTLGQLQGRTVIVRDDAGMAQLGAVHNIIGKGENRAIVIKDANGKLSRHAQGQVWTNDSSAPAGNPTTPTAPTPTPALSATPRTDPGPTADPTPTNSRPYAAETQTLNLSDLESASAGGNSAVVGPTLGELVPDTATDAAPLTLTMSGQPVRAFRNEEGDVELHHADGQISVLDKGQQFDHPAADFLLDATSTQADAQSLDFRDLKTASPNAIKPGDMVTVGNESLPVEDVLRGKSGRIEAVMVEGKNGSRVLEADTPDGKAALAELNAREVKSENRTSPADLPSAQPTPATQPTDSQERKITPPKPVPTYSTPTANREAGAFTKDGRTYTRQEPIANRAVQGKESTATFADGVNVPVRYALMEADELQPSHTGGSQNLNHFIPESQPKNRSAAFDQASQKSISDIAANPDVAQLGQAPTAYAGAPVVNARGEVIQGNGRGEGIRQHYRGQGQAYRAGILSEAQRVGIDPKQAAQLKNPVLVRIADVSDVRARELGNHTAADTESGGARRLDAKQAAGRMDAEARADLGRLLTPGEDATLTETIQGKQSEVLNFLQKNKLANATQLQTMFRADGTLTVQGMEDVTALHRQLLFADGDTNLPELFQDLPVAAQNGLDRAVGYLAGMPAEKSIIPEIQSAIAGVRAFRATGASFTNWTRTTDLFAAESERTPADKYSPLELALIKLLAEEKRPTFIAKAFAQFAFATTGNPATLFDAISALSRAEAVQKTFNVTDEKPRNPAGTQSPARPSAADGRPAPPPARGMESPAKDAQRANQPDAANPQRPGRNQTTEQLDSPAAKRQAALDKIKERRAQQGDQDVVKEDYTQAYETRPGEPESIRESGHQALKAVERASRRGKGVLLPDAGDNSGGRSPVLPEYSPAAKVTALNRAAAKVTQSDISADLREKGYVSFVGRAIKNVGELAAMAQIFRDPRLETMRYFLMKTLPDGSSEVVGHLNMSSRMPASTPAFPDPIQRGGLSGADWLKQQMQNVGADGWYALHNHPSGRVNPSRADLDYTKHNMAEVPGFKGHIIINHKKFALLSALNGNMKGDVRVEERGLPGLFDENWQPTFDPLLQPSLPGPLLGRSIANGHELAALGKELEARKDLVYLIGRGPEGYVAAVGTMPLATMIRFGGSLEDGKGIERGEAAIRKFARETGSANVIIVGLPKPKGRVNEYMTTPRDRAYLAPSEFYMSRLIIKGVLLDAVDVTGKSIRAQTNNASNDWIGPVPVPRVWENVAPYGVSQDDMADFRTVLESYAEEGTVGTKAMAARFREDVGSPAETGLSDLSLKELVKEVQQSAGIVPVQKPGKQAKKQRAHAQRYDEATRASFTENEAEYMPRKVVENRESADAYIRQVGIDNAYAVALDKPEGITAGAHIEIQENVAVAYRKLSDEAMKAGDKKQAAEFWQRSKDARAAKISALTSAGQTLAQVASFVAEDPDSVLDLAIREIEKQRKPKLAKADKAGARVADIVTRERQATMQDVLKAPAVQKAREAVTGTEAKAEKEIVEPTGYGANNRYFSKAKAVEARAALRKLGLSTIVPPELVHLVGYHIEALARVGGDKSFAEVSKRIVREVGAQFKPLLPAAYQTAREQFVKSGGPNKGFTEPADVAALVAPAVVKSGMKALGTTLDRLAREQAAGIGPKGKSLAERFVSEGGLSPKDAATYAAAIEAEFAKQVHARKATLRARIVTMSTRVLLGRQAATAVDKLLTTLNLAVDPATATDLLKAQLKLPNITPEQADKFVKLSEAVRNAKPGNQRADRVQDLMREMSQLEDVDWRDAAQAMWFANTLSGFLTHATNVVSNAHQGIAETAISVMHVWAGTGSLKAATGPLRGVGRAQQRAWAEAARVIKTGYSGPGNEKFDAGGKNYLENKYFAGIAKPLNSLKYVQRALVAEDNYASFTLRGMRAWEVAVKEAYREVRRDASLSGEKLNNAALYERAYSAALGKLHGIDDLHAAADSQADAENLTGKAKQARVMVLVNEAVQARLDGWEKQAQAEGLQGLDKAQRVGELQQEAMPANIVADAQQFAKENTFNDGLPGTVGAFASLIGKVGDIPVVGLPVLRVAAPFTRIAASVLDRHLDYTLWGLVRAARGSHGPKEFGGVKHFRELTIEQRQKSATRAILGTVGALTLYGLAKAGQIAITGAYAPDKDKAEQEPEYSIKFANGLFVSYKGWPVELELAAIGNLLDHDRRQAKKGKPEGDAKRMAVVLALIAQYSASVGPSDGLDTFTKGILDAARNPDQSLKYFARFAAQTGKNMVPLAALDQQALRGLNILRGEAVKEQTSDGAWSAAYASLTGDVPWLRDSAEDAINVFGERMKLSSKRLWGFLPEERTEADQANLTFLAERDLMPKRCRITDPSLSIFDGQKLRPMTGPEFTVFMIARGHALRDALREAMLRPSDLPGLPAAARAAILAAGPDANQTLREMSPAMQKKVVARLRKNSIAAGKQAVLDSHQPKPANK